MSIITTHQEPQGSSSWHYINNKQPCLQINDTNQANRDHSITHTSLYQRSALHLKYNEYQNGNLIKALTLTKKFMQYALNTIGWPLFSMPQFLGQLNWDHYRTLLSCNIGLVQVWKYILSDSTILRIMLLFGSTFGHLFLFLPFDFQTLTIVSLVTITFCIFISLQILFTSFSFSLFFFLFRLYNIKLFFTKFLLRTLFFYEPL